MKGVTGILNDSAYVHFKTLALYEGTPSFLIKGSTWLEKGSFTPVEHNGSESTIYVSYKDIIHTVEIRFTESRAFPLSKIYVRLPNPDRLNVSEFFVKGHFNFSELIISSKNSRAEGSVLNNAMDISKKVSIADRIFIERIGDPELKLSVLETEFGQIKEYKITSTAEI